MKRLFCVACLWLAALSWGGSLSVAGSGAHAVVDGAKPHVSSSSENIFFTNWGYGTYTLTASPGSPYVFVAEATEISAGEPNGTNSVKKTITDTNANPENFSLGMRGKMYIPGGEGGSPIDWSASINTKFFYIKSNQSGGAKAITVPAGTSVTYTAYEGSSSTKADWTVNGMSKNNESSIIFSRSWWDVPAWFDASMGTPKPGIYSIAAKPTGKSSPSDSGTMTVVGVASVSGHGKTSTRKETPSGTDKWTDSETIYVQPQSVVVLTMALYPSVTLNDTLKQSISWSVSGLFSTITPNNSNRLEATFKPGSAGDYVITASCGASQKLIRVKAVVPKIYSVTFGGNIKINKDTGGSYSGVAWQDNDLDGSSDLSNANADSSKKYHPIAYRSTATMSATAVFKPNCRNSNDTDFISAYDVEAAVKKVRFTPYSFWNSNNWSTPTALIMEGTSVTAVSAFYPSAKVGYDGSFELAWEVGFGGAGTADNDLSWARSYSENELYLTYDAAIPSFETVFHIGCTNGAGTTDAASYISSIWGGYFSSNDVKRKGSNNILKYWGVIAQASSYPRGYGNLLNLEDGRCGEWNQFFQAVTAVQGFPSSPSVTSWAFSSPFSAAASGTIPVSATGFLVKNWNFGTSTGTGEFPYKRGEYTASTNSGKGNSSSQPWFFDHVVSDINGKIYDPSYGLKTNSRRDYQSSAIAGWFDNYVTLSPFPSSINDYAPDNATNQVSDYDL